MPVSSGGTLEALGPGLYTAEVGKEQKRFAVNVDPAESRLAPLPMDELERLGAPILASTATLPSATGKADLQFAELENRQKLWRWLIAATLVALLIETWLGGRTARRREQSAAEAVS